MNNDRDALLARIAALTVRPGETVDEPDPRFLAVRCAEMLREAIAERDELRSDNRELRQDYAALRENSMHVLGKYAEDLRRACATIAELRAEIADLRTSVVAFAVPVAMQYAEEHEFPPHHLYHAHYDILARAGARMVDFVRWEPKE